MGCSLSCAQRGFCCGPGPSSLWPLGPVRTRRCRPLENWAAHPLLLMETHSASPLIPVSPCPCGSSWTGDAGVLGPGTEGLPPTVAPGFTQDRVQTQASTEFNVKASLLGKP